ncbi:MAG: phosphoribosylformylglycinamidine synthase subunit PurS [Chloroflexota bacterium]
MFLAKIYVTLKPAVNDPQGITVRGGLHSLGFTGVTEVRVGKYMEVSLATTDEAEAVRQVDEMSRKLLSNPVIEDYRFDLVPV